MHQALYRKYRPAVFEDVCGQSHVTDVLSYAAERGKVLGRTGPDKETVAQALAYRAALARRPGWNHPIAAAVVEVCGNSGCNWFDLPESGENRFMV